MQNTLLFTCSYIRHEQKVNISISDFLVFTFSHVCRFLEGNVDCNKLITCHCI